MNIIELAKEAGFDDLFIKYGKIFLTKFAAIVRAEALAEQFRDATKMVAEPLKQEPVAWMKSNDTCTQLSFERFNSGAIPLYAAPVDAKAIRAEALEEAAKHLAESGLIGSNDCAAAIRGLK